MAVFKSYLRGLLVILMELRELIANDDKDKALEKLDQLIQNTKNGIED